MLLFCCLLHSVVVLERETENLFEAGKPSELGPSVQRHRLKESTT